eukprot:8607219-Pyramimonas_sp.AAC.1
MKPQVSATTKRVDMRELRARHFVGLDTDTDHSLLAYSIRACYFAFANRERLPSEQPEAGRVEFSNNANVVTAAMKELAEGV